jgi:hypothetical protein
VTGSVSQAGEIQPIGVPVPLGDISRYLLISGRRRREREDRGLL